ncbi:MAG: hypothetical protein K2Q20_01690 [Phycisphaerales bacterium]|nr:hypothetical protein [Phycisphaerales bacterium]
MLNRLAKPLAILLLLVQVVSCLARGEQGLCIPTGDCGHHDVAHHADTERHHHSEGGCDHQACCKGHTDDGGLSTAGSIDDCGCCVHLPAPGDHQPGPHTRADAGAMRLLPVALAPAVMDVLFARPAAAVWASPPDPGRAAASRALKVTRLLI